MIKILIVDDEEFIRQGMRYTIPWEEHDMEVIGEASNGAEALKTAVELQPDIVLADIQMPVMNGLELAKELNRLLPKTKIIILTAHGNSENLTEAIEARVSSFLLKNADREKILNAMLKVKEEILTERRQFQKQEQLKTIYQENRQLIQSTLLYRYLKSQVSYEHFSKKQEKLGLEFHGPFYSIILMRCNDTDNPAVIGTLMQVFYQYQSFISYLSEDKVIAVLSHDEGMFSRETLMQSLPEISPYLFGNSIAVICSLPSVRDFPPAYRLLSQALEYCFWDSEHPVTEVNVQHSFTSGTASPDHLYLLESGIMGAVLSRQDTQPPLALQEYYSYAEKSLLPRKIFLESICRLIVFFSALSDDKAETLGLIQLIHEMETPDEIMDVISSLIAPQKQHPANQQIAPALEYIKLHYTEECRLEDAAKAAYLSTGYLSRIFKPETGYSFKEYIHRLRILKAQELIRDTKLKYYEIAERVGYKDYKYFSGYFSKITGCSASDYRTSAGHGQH